MHFVFFGGHKNHEISLSQSWILVAERPKLKMAAKPRRRAGEQNYFTQGHNLWIPTHTQILRVGQILTLATLQ